MDLGKAWRLVEAARARDLPPRVRRADQRRAVKAASLATFVWHGLDASDKSTTLGQLQFVTDFVLVLRMHAHEMQISHATASACRPQRNNVGAHGTICNELVLLKSLKLFEPNPLRKGTVVNRRCWTQSTIWYKHNG